MAREDKMSGLDYVDTCGRAMYASDPYGGGQQRDFYCARQITVPTLSFGALMALFFRVPFDSVSKMGLC